MTHLIITVTFLAFVEVITLPFVCKRAKKAHIEEEIEDDTHENLC